MFAQDDLDPTAENEDNYEGLLVSIEASEGILSLLIAVCDDSNCRDRIIERYEAEVQPNIRPYRVELPRGEPSMRAAIAKLVKEDEYLNNGGRAVITVTGAEKLFFLKLGAERSEQEIFFGYLQWTREGLREFRYPIVLWVTNQILVELIKKAPDFWSWRKGVFHFKSKKTGLIDSTEIIPLRPFINDNNIDDKEPYLLPLEDLKELIQQIEAQKGIKDPSLSALYSRMGHIYLRRLHQGQCQDYKHEQELAIKYIDKAITLQKELDLGRELINNINNLAYLYSCKGQYREAEKLLIESLGFAKIIIEDEDPIVIAILNSLATIYAYQGRHNESESVLTKVLKSIKKIIESQEFDIKINKSSFISIMNNSAAIIFLKSRNSAAEAVLIELLQHSISTFKDKNLQVAYAFNNLAKFYYSEGRYTEAEPLFQQALEIEESLLGEEHPDVAASFNELGMVYYSQGRYAEAEPLLLQALELRKHLFGEKHPNVAVSLSNLGMLYYSESRYTEAEPLLLQALELRKQLLGEEHLDVAISLSNLGKVYYSQGKYTEAEPLFLQALELIKLCLGDAHPNFAAVLNGLANVYGRQKRYTEAEPLYLQAIEINERLLGIEHPQTITIRKNLGKVREEMRNNSSDVATASAIF